MDCYLTKTRGEKAVKCNKKHSPSGSWSSSSSVQILDSDDEQQQNSNTDMKEWSSPPTATGTGSDNTDAAGRYDDNEEEDKEMARSLLSCFDEIAASENHENHENQDDGEDSPSGKIEWKPFTQQPCFEQTQQTAVTESCDGIGGAADHHDSNHEPQ